MSDTYVDISQVPAFPRSNRYNPGIVGRLRAIPEGKALPITPIPPQKLQNLASTIHAISHKYPARLYHTRQDPAKNCVWAWWTPREEQS